MITGCGIVIFDLGGAALSIFTLLIIKYVTKPDGVTLVA